MIVNIFARPGEPIMITFDEPVDVIRDTNCPGKLIGLSGTTTDGEKIDNLYHHITEIKITELK